MKNSRIKKLLRTLRTTGVFRNRFVIMNHTQEFRFHEISIKSSYTGKAYELTIDLTDLWKPIRSFQSFLDPVSILFRLIYRFLFPTSCAHKIFFPYIWSIDVQTSTSFPFVKPYKAQNASPWRFSGGNSGWSPVSQVITPALSMEIYNLKV